MKRLTDRRRRQILTKAGRDLGEPVVPVSRVCAAIMDWAKAMEAEPDNGMLGSGIGMGLTPQVVKQMVTTMWKSNLLHRLIYLDEPVRTEKCPKHKGHWSGCSWSQPYCDCQKIISPIDGQVYYDSNVTGWLLDGNPPATGE